MQSHTSPLPEHWLRGPVAGIPSLLQPVAHALLQATGEIKEGMTGYPEGSLWERPAGAASPGFHLLHIAGVLDRLCTYAKGAALSEEQLVYLKAEETPQPYTVEDLVRRVESAVQHALEQLKRTGENTLTEPRSVGRKALPSTVMGLLFHAAEHTMRHLGQLLVTVKVVKEGRRTP